MRLTKRGEMLVSLMVALFVAVFVVVLGHGIEDVWIHLTTGVWN